MARCPRRHARPRTSRGSSCVRQHIRLAVARSRRAGQLHTPALSRPGGLKATSSTTRRIPLRGDRSRRHGTGRFLLCYDADSRPPVTRSALRRRRNAHPGGEVFHQSSRFELRQPRHTAAADGTPPRSTLVHSARTDSCSPTSCPGCSTGHHAPPAPGASPAPSSTATSPGMDSASGSPCCAPCRSRPAHPWRTCTTASSWAPADSRWSPSTAWTTPRWTSLRTQLEQAARWFAGPGRFAAYLKDPATCPGWRARAMALSAFGSAAEWIGCLIVPALVCVVIATGSPAVRVAAGCFAAVCLQAGPDRGLARDREPGRRAANPRCASSGGLHGARSGRRAGVGRLVAGGSGTGKTERGPGA